MLRYLVFQKVSIFDNLYKSIFYFNTTREKERRVDFFDFNMKLNALKPSVREKKRYICFKVDKNVTSNDVSKILLSRIKKWIGEKYFSLGRVYFMSKFYENGKGIISCNHKQLADVKAGLVLVDKLDVDVFYVSGTLKKARAESKNYV